LTDDEADKLLTTFDSVSAMVTADPEKLSPEISTKSDAVQTMLEQMTRDNGISASNFSEVDNGTQGLLDQEKTLGCRNIQCECELQAI
jgi:hypothetical protein